MKLGSIMMPKENKMAKQPASAVPVQAPQNPIRNPITPLNQTNPNSKDKS
jgi:hypothetical protein